MNAPMPPVGTALAAETPSALSRSCPRCGEGMMPAATLCSGCWLRVAPMPADGIEPAPLAVHHPWWKLWP